MFEVGENTAVIPGLTPTYPFSQTVRGAVSFNGGDGSDRLEVDDRTYLSVGNYAIGASSIRNAFTGTGQVGYDRFVENIDFYSREGETTTFTTVLANQNFRFFNGTGNGIGRLIVDDRSFLASPVEMDVYPDRIVTRGGPSAFITEYELRYSGYESLDVYTNNSTNAVNVFGTSPDITTQTTVRTGPGNDIVTLYPHGVPAAGAALAEAAGGAADLTFVTLFDMFGGGGSDTLRVDDTASASPIVYRVYNAGAILTSIDGLGPAPARALNDVETVAILAGGGNDTFAVDTAKTGAAVLINGGGGDDVLNIGAGNLAASIDNIASFTFDGQAGYDTFNLNNTASSLDWQHGVHGTAITSAQGAYSLQLNYAGAERLGINAGAGNDSAVIYSQSPGVLLVVNGGNGNDTLTGNGGSLTLENLRGPIQFNGEGGIDNRVNLFDYTDATGDVAHLDQNSVGSFPGDNLFGEGGSLSFTSVARIDLQFGTGADTIYVQPNVSALLFIHGNEATEAPSDNFRLSLAGVTSPVFTPNGAGTARTHLATPPQSITQALNPRRPICQAIIVAIESLGPKITTSGEAVSAWLLPRHAWRRQRQPDRRRCGLCSLAKQFGCRQPGRGRRDFGDGTWPRAPTKPDSCQGPLRGARRQYSIH